MPKYILFDSPRQDKRFAVMNEEGKVIHFGQPGATTYSDGATDKKKAAYLARHSKGGENWEYSGRDTAGFWSRWLLWNKNSVKASMRDLKSRFGIKVDIDDEL